MLELVVDIVSLAHLAWQTCKDAKQHKQECLRIGERLMNLIALTQEWERSQTQQNRSRSPSHTVLRSLEKVLTRLNMILQAANLPKKRWGERVKRFVDSHNILDELLASERDLNSVLQDCQFQIGSATFQQSAEHFSRIEQMLTQVATNQKKAAEEAHKPVDAGRILVYLAEQKNPNDPTAQTFQQQMDCVLKVCQTKPPKKLEDVENVKMPMSSYTTATDSTTSTSVSVSSFMSSSMPFPASDGEILVDLNLDMRQLQCSFGAQDLIGEGGFSQVFRAVYQDSQVAIKRLKVHEVDLIKMTEREKRRQIHRIQAEAEVMSKACIHPNITQLLGCRAVLNETERPLLVMELMETSLFKALHEGQIPSFSKRLDLLKGVASALEFLHIRGIVHQDIKTMNILLTEGLDTAKLADFGEAKEKGFATTHAMTTSMFTGAVGSAGSGGASGTLAYRAPEVLLQQVKEASRKAEIHTIGVVLWECMTTEIPHQGKGPMELLLLAQKKETPCMLDVPRQPPAFCNTADILAWQTLRNAAKACLSRAAWNRPTASEVVKALFEGPSHVFQQSTPAVTRPHASERVARRELRTVREGLQHHREKSKEAQQPIVLADHQHELFQEKYDEKYDVPHATEDEERSCCRMQTCIWLCCLLLLGAVGAGVAFAYFPSAPSSKKISTEEGDNSSVPSWTPVGSKIAGVSAGDGFGDKNALALSWDGTIVAVGDKQNNADVATNVGYVQVFQRVGGTWQPMGAALQGAAEFDWFGSSVALSSNAQILAVGAIEHFADGPGYVRVFEYDSTRSKWNPRGPKIVGVVAGEEFGTSVSLSENGNTLAVAAPENSDNGYYAGHVRVFAYYSNSNEWEQKGSTLSGIAAYDLLGSSVDLSADGTILAVGAEEYDEYGIHPGYVRVFQFNSTSNDWDPLGEAIPGVAGGDQFGTSVSLSSNGMVLAAGATWNKDNGRESGHVHVFDYNTTFNQWTLRGSAIVGVDAYDSFGESAALSADGNQLAVGASRNNDIAIGSGHVRVFQYEESNGSTTTGDWKQVGAALTGEGDEKDYFGRSVVMSADGSVVAGGAKESYDDGQGYVCVYERVVE